MPDQTLSWNEARHLLAHTGFGGRPEEIEALAGLSRQVAVEQLLDAQDLSLDEPEWLHEPVRRPRSLSREERQQLQRQNREQLQELLDDWLQRMLATPSPAAMLQQRMILLWHGHLPVQMRKVKRSAFIFHQLQLFHQEALGNAGEMLHAIIRDPAMIAFLDNQSNRRGKPNENLARELMELFSLGPGAYTEADIREGARALTGYSLGIRGFMFRRFAHDSGVKTLLGATGRFDGDDFVDLILQQPACAKFLTAKLWHTFTGTEPPAAQLTEWAALLRRQKYDLKPLLRAMFTHDAFYSDHVVGQQIRDPIHLVIGTGRLLRLPLPSRTALALLRQLGQMPFSPPNVKGWPGGRAWIDTSRLLVRYGLAELIASTTSSREMRQMMRTSALSVDTEALFESSLSPADQVGALAKLLLPLPIPAEQLDVLLHAYQQDLQGDLAAAQRRLLGNIMLLPHFQLT